MKFNKILRYSLLNILGLLFVINSFAQCDTIIVEAEKGEGIYSVLRKYEYELKYFNEFIEINKENIGKDSSLIIGRKYKLPCKPEMIENFNKELAETKDTLTNTTTTDTQVKDSLLHGAIFYLIAGHGGPDPGAVTWVDGHMITEDEYAYDITLRLKRDIETHGGKAFMIIIDPYDSIRNDKFLKHDKNELCYPNLTIPLDQNARLIQRADAVNKLYDSIGSSIHQRVVEIHLDSRAVLQKIDVFFYHHSTSTKGKKLAEILLQTFEEKYKEHQPNRGYFGSVSSRNLMVLRKTKPIGVFLELGNITNERDQKRFLNPNNRDALAKWICLGLIKEYELYKK